MVASVAFAARIAVLTSERLLPKDASKARELARGARRTYLRTVEDPQRPCSCMRQTSMPLAANHIAPVTLNECPVDLGAPDCANSARPRWRAMATIVSTTAFFAGDSPVVAGNRGDADPAPRCDEAHAHCASNV